MPLLLRRANNSPTCISFGKKDMSKVLIISDKDDGGFFEDLNHFCNKKILKISNIDISECEDKQFFLIQK